MWHKNILFILLGVLCLFMGLSILVGAGEIGISESLSYLFSASRSEIATMTLWSLRLPRTLAAVLVGASLGVAGLMMQTATRNHLAEPGLLGINAGAALGVVLGMVFMGAESGLSYLIWAILGALIGHLCVLIAAHLDRHADAPLRLILAGAALSAFFHGLTTAILLNQPNGYDQYRFWILGSLTGATFELLSWIAPVILLGLLLACSFARPLSVLSLGDEMAHALGYQAQKQRLFCASIVTVLTGSAVALAGPIAFLGLLAPFLARHFYSHAAPAQKMLLAALLGAFLLLTADMLARSVMRPFEAPVSVITALLGAPFWIWMARTSLGVLNR